MKIDLQPIRTPNFILAKSAPRKRQDGFKTEMKWAISEVSADILSDLCDAFRAEMFKKAGKKDPRCRENGLPVPRFP